MLPSPPDRLRALLLFALPFVALTALAAAPGRREAPYEPLVDQALEATREVYPVPKALVFAVMRQESAFDPKAVSKVGARGLMQLMPYNAEKVGVKPEDLFTPSHNILAGVRLLAVLLRFYKGDVIASLIAYNSHPRDISAKIPKNGETPDYCVRVLAFYRQYLVLYPQSSSLPDAGSAPDDAGGLPAPSPPQPPRPPAAINVVLGR